MTQVVRRAVFPVVLAAIASVSPAPAQERVTISSLIQAGYSVVSTFMTPIGPALWLQGESDLYFCVAKETSTTQTLTTQYCKLVE